MVTKKTTKCRECQAVVMIVETPKGLTKLVNNVPDGEPQVSHWQTCTAIARRGVSR